MWTRPACLSPHGGALAGRNSTDSGKLGFKLRVKRGRSHPTNRPNMLIVTVSLNAHQALNDTCMRP